METDVRSGEWVDPGLSRVTFGEWAAEYLGTIVHLRAVTQGNYARPPCATPSVPTTGPPG